MEVMTPNHKLWKEFCERLEGPEGCNFRKEDGKTHWDCSSEMDRPHTKAILETMGGFDVETSLRIFSICGGYCDCEVLFNVEDTWNSRA